jgi:hypothetical protein
MSKLNHLYTLMHNRNDNNTPSDNNIQENDNAYDSDNSGISSDMEGSNSDPDALRERSLHYNENINFTQSIINELKAVLHITEKAEAGNLTEGEKRIYEEYKEELDPNRLIHTYDDNKSFSENLSE